MDKFIIYKKNKTIITILLLLYILLFPNGLSFILDGVPFNQNYEKVIILVILPILLIFYKNYLYKKIFIYIIIFIITLKFLLLYSPNIGIFLKQYLYNVDQKIEIKTYESIWNSEGLIQSNNWDNLKKFPLEWTNYYSTKENIETKDSSEKFDFFQSKIEYSLNGSLYLDDNEFYFIIANKIIEQDIKIINHKSKKIYIVPVFNDLNIFLKTKNNIKIEKGFYSIIGYLKFQNLNDQTKFEHYISSNEEIISPFKSKRIFTSSKYNNFLFIFCSYIFDFSIIFLLFYMFINIIISNYKNHNKYITKFNIVFLLSTLFLVFFSNYISEYLLNLSIKFSGKNLEKIFLNLFDNQFSISIYFFMIILFILSLILRNIISNKKNKFNDKNNFLYLFLLIGIPIFLYAFIWIDQIDKFAIHEKGNDWFVFQYFSRQIVIFKQFIKAGEEIIYYRPLARYIFAIIHYIFGQSYFPQMIIEVWFILFSVFLFYLTSNLIFNNQRLSFLFAVILLFLFFTDSFKIILGKGLSEFYALLPIAFLTYYFSLNKINDLRLNQIFLLGLVGSIGILFREDHLIVIASLIVFSFDIQNKYLNKFYIDLFLSIKNNFFKLFLYLFILVISLFLIYLRNYYVSDNFDFFGHYNVSGHKLGFAKLIFENMYLIISGNNYPGMLRLFSIFTIISLILAIYNLFLQYKITNIRLNFLSLIIISILLPYFFVTTQGYPPRYSIHLLPFSLLLIFGFVNYNKNNNV